MKCIRCGYESVAPFVRCPKCGAAQNQPVSSAPVAGNARQGRSGGETAAIVIAVVTAVLSIAAAFVIFTAFMSRFIVKTFEDGNYGIDSIDDFDSNDFDDDVEKFIRDYYDKKNKNSQETPAGLNTPISFKETLYSFSAGDVENDYEVSMMETYRGEAALKLLEGAALPIYNDSENDIYLVRFNVKITGQDVDAIVPVPLGSPSAFPYKTDELFSDKYSYINQLPYANRLKLVSKDDVTEIWAAFIVSKEDENPCIKWNHLENKVFRNPGAAVTDAALVESGAAIEIIESVQSDTSDEESSQE